MSKYLENTYRGKRVLITGHTGFKGSWLSLWLTMLGAKVYGVSLDPCGDLNSFSAIASSLEINDFRHDIRDGPGLNNLVSQIKPDFVFHLAAQALVGSSYVDPVATYTTNTIGTLNILEALKLLDNECVAILITSDKVYNNKEWVWGYRETDELGGFDPYSSSKSCAEMIIKSHVNSYFSLNFANIKIKVARAGNVIGGGDWSDNRLIPDCIKSWSVKKIVTLRNPNSTRPWQHVLEPLSGYLCLGAYCRHNNTLQGDAFNFGPQPENNYTVESLVENMSVYWRNVRWTSKPDIENQIHEAGLLRLNCDKASSILDWTPALNFSDTVKLTAEWYKNYYENLNCMMGFSENQIAEYINISQIKGVKWAQ